MLPGTLCVCFNIKFYSLCGVGGGYRYWMESTIYPSQPGQALVSDKSVLCPWPPFYLIRKIDSGKGFPLINQECPTFVDERASWEAAERYRGAQSSPHTLWKGRQRCGFQKWALWQAEGLGSPEYKEAASKRLTQPPNS